MTDIATSVESVKRLLEMGVPVQNIHVNVEVSSRPDKLEFGGSGKRITVHFDASDPDTAETLVKEAMSTIAMAEIHSKE